MRQTKQLRQAATLGDRRRGMATQRMSPLGAGLRRLWAEREIYEGRPINGSTLAREASGFGGPVQPSTPLGIVLGRKGWSGDELSRICAYFGVSQEDIERIGNGDRSWLDVVVKGWAT